MSSKNKHKTSQKKRNKTSSKKKPNNTKSNKRNKSKKKQVNKHKKKSRKKYTGDKSSRHKRHLNSVQKSIKARQEKRHEKKQKRHEKKQKKKQKSQNVKKEKNIKPSYTKKKKLNSKNKNIKTDKRKKDRSDRLYIQRKRDIEMAKKRLDKKRISTSIIASNNRLKVATNDSDKTVDIQHKNGIDLEREKRKRKCSQVKMLTSKSYYFQDEIKENNKKDLNENKRKSKLKSTIAEIKVFMDSERIYVYEGLSIGLNTFLNRLYVHNEINKSIISEKDIHLIFGNYETIYNINNKLYDDLKELSLNNGVNKLIYGFAQKMLDFIPYFKMYTDYIVHKQNAIKHLEHLKKTNKTFKQFLNINELIAKTKLKLLLEEPAHRIPQYLKYLVNIYTSYKHETNANNKGEKLLLQSITDIKKVSDEIAIKCRDLRSRLLVGTLQRDYFCNKIKLLSPHRFCIAYSSCDMLLNDKHKIKCFKFILLNDIFLISTFPSTFKNAQLKAVYPLIGLRISITSKGHKILLLPSNIVIIFCNKHKMEKWIHIISTAVDAQEHCLNIVNVIDLEKRIRKQKTSKEGENQSIAVTNPQRIKAIEKWKKKKLSFVSIRKPQKIVKRAKSRRCKTFGGIKQKQKGILSKLSSFKNMNSSQDMNSVHVKNNNQKIDKVRVMRDEEILQFDEEIPMENFMKALNSGFVKIRNDEEQNEQYRKAANTAKNLVDSSLQSYRASVFYDHWDSSDSDDDWD